jgi:ribonuclease HI
MLVIYTDGACFGNPGPMGIGIVIYADGKIVREISEYIGEGTNNIAEYSALIRALKEVKKLGEREVVIRTDSQLLVRQLSGEYKIKNKKLKELKALANDLMAGLVVKIEHIPREQNAEADELSKRAAEKGAKK